PALLVGRGRGHCSAGVYVHARVAGGVPRLRWAARAVALGARRRAAARPCGAVALSRLRDRGDGRSGAASRAARGRRVRARHPARGLRTLLGRRGLAPLHTHHVLAEHNPFGLWQSAVSRATPTPSWLYLALKRAAPVRAGDLVPTVLALPLVPVAALVELGAGL